MKILFFIESLHSGGRERRVVELLTHLQETAKYEIMIVLMKKEIHYKKFLDLKIPFIIIERKWGKKDPFLFIKFFKICVNFNPDIVHTWGNMASFYSLFSTIILRKPLINSQITRSLVNVNKWSMFHFMSSINFYFSKVILSNSIAGLLSHGISLNKGKVIYNGVNLNRFNNLTDKDEVKLKYGIKTQFSLVMVASFSTHKDYNLFLELAKILFSIRKDLTFIAVGGGPHLESIKSRVIDEQILNIVFTGIINNVESLINISDIGVLFSNNLVHGEGISNSIIEYMALGKPVIANDSGGTKEIVNNENGYLITNESNEKIALIINDLLNDNEQRYRMGEAGKKLIHESFSIERMGQEFEKLYQNTI